MFVFELPFELFCLFSFNVKTRKCKLLSFSKKNRKEIKIKEVSWLVFFNLSLGLAPKPESPKEPETSMARDNEATTPWMRGFIAIRKSSHHWVGPPRVFSEGSLGIWKEKTNQKRGSSWVPFISNLWNLFLSKLLFPGLVFLELLVLASSIKKQEFKQAIMVKWSSYWSQLKANSQKQWWVWRRNARKGSQRSFILWKRGKQREMISCFWWKERRG